MSIEQRILRAALRLLLAMAFCGIASASAASVRAEPYRVLLLNSLRAAYPINDVFTAGIVRGLASVPSIAPEIDGEYLDLTRLHDSQYVPKLLEVLRLKYRDRQPNVIVATYTPALRLLLDHGEAVFPGVPIVYCGVDSDFVASRSMPPAVTGIGGTDDYSGTIELMAALDPGLRNIALIVGTDSGDQALEAQVRESLRAYRSRFVFTWLRGMPVPELIVAANALPSHSAILFLNQLQDREGAPVIPRSLLSQLAPATAVPIYGLWDTLLGSGVVGGRMSLVEDVGFVAGAMAARVLAGEAPSAIPIVQGFPAATVLDARQLRRLGVSERRWPKGSRIVNREPSLWSDHRSAIIVAAGVVAAQALLIAALLVNRSRLRRTQAELRREYDHRVQAENVSGALRSRLENFNKQSALGALATGIAHEVNQPLVAIKNYVEAARRYVSRDPPNRPKLDELLRDVADEAGRAASIVQRIRAVIGGGRVEAVATTLPVLVGQVLREMEPELTNHECRVIDGVDASLPDVHADPIQIQVVLVNLLRNAMESLRRVSGQDKPPIMVSASRASEEEIEIRVADRGEGIATDAGQEVFEPLFSTKATGMGVGLATSRAIVEAHGGKIWFSSNAPCGTIFHFTLPVAPVPRLP